MSVHVCVHICTGIYLHVMYVYMCTYVDKLRCQVNDCYHVDIPSFLCHLISFPPLSPFPPLSLSCFPYSMSLSCFCFIKSKIKKNLKKIFL